MSDFSVLTIEIVLALQIRAQLRPKSTSKIKIDFSFGEVWNFLWKNQQSLTLIVNWLNPRFFDLAYSSDSVKSTKGTSSSTSSISEKRSSAETLLVSVATTSGLSLSTSSGNSS